MAFPFINAILQYFDNSGNVLSGGLLYTYAPGTTTPKTTYTDENLSVPNANPIVLDSAGRCVIFLADGEEYKFVLQTSAGVTIKTVDEVKSPTALTAAEIGEALFPRTAREIAASVTPVNYSFPEGNLLRYGTNTTPGTTDMASAFATAISLRMPIIVPAGLYRHNGQMAEIVEGGLIGEKVNTSQLDGDTRIVFYNITGATQAAIRLSYSATNANGLRFLENLSIFASSWDNTTGANGYGVEITGPSRLRNIQIAGFEVYNLFLHNTATDGQAPYASLLENVFSTHAGQHGIVVGTGANTVTFINCDSKYSGAPSYLTAPSVAGNYDGFHVDYQNAGNPGSAFFSYVPEGITVIGGDCSYNSRYGWNFLACQSGKFMTSYAEGNLQASPGQVNLSSGLTNCFLLLDGISGRRAGVNFAMIGSGTDLGSNRVFVGGRDCGGGQSNTATSCIQMSNALSTTYFGHNADFTNATRIGCDTNGVANISADGTGYWNLTTGLRHTAVQVVGARKTGWTPATGTATRSSFVTSTVTTEQLAERVKALIDDLHNTAGHGLIGT